MKKNMNDLDRRRFQTDALMAHPFEISRTIPENANGTNEEKKHSFRKDDIKSSLPLETETELLLKKMERMQKKKNNYKNVDVLENIYDTKLSKTENGGFLSGISNFLQNLDCIVF
jgi:hypothetical protein